MFVARVHAPENSDHSQCFGRRGNLSLLKKSLEMIMGFGRLHVLVF